jgi:hypothetical protein
MKKPEEFEKNNTKKINWTAIATIIALIGLAWSFLQYSNQLRLQRETELNEHISNIKSLELELCKDIEAMDNLISMKENLTKKTIHAQLILENLERSVDDGKIFNVTVKNFIMKSYFDGVELNQRILYVNSPEFISLTLSNVTGASEAIKHFRDQTVDFTEKIHKPSFVTTLKIVIDYKNCLENKRDINSC